MTARCMRWHQREEAKVVCYIETFYSHVTACLETNQRQDRRKTQAQTRTKRHQANRQVENSDNESSYEGELMCRFSHYPRPIERATDLNPDAEPFEPDTSWQDGAVDQEDAETDIRDIAAGADGEDGVTEPEEGLQESPEDDDPDPPPKTSYPGRD